MVSITDIRCHEDRHCRVRSLPKAPTHDQCQESNPRHLEILIQRNSVVAIQALASVACPPPHEFTKWSAPSIVHSNTTPVSPPSIAHTQREREVRVTPASGRPLHVSSSALARWHCTHREGTTPASPHRHTLRLAHR